MRLAPPSSEPHTGRHPGVPPPPPADTDPTLSSWSAHTHKDTFLFTERLFNHIGAPCCCQVAVDLSLSFLTCPGANKMSMPDSI